MSNRSFAYSGSDMYRPGGAWFICDVCSQRYRRSAMFIRWDNLRVDAACNDPRPPTMSIPDVFPEGIPFPDARPPQDRPDRLEDDTALQSVTGGVGVQYGVTYPNGQNQQPGALSPLPLTESVDPLGGPYLPEPGNPTVGTPIGPNVLADDVTFITGPIAAPMNTFDTIPPAIPAPNPPPVPPPLPPPAPAPVWVTALKAPSGELPIIVLDFANGRYWAAGAVRSVNDVVISFPTWGTWDATAAIVPGLGVAFDQQTANNGTIADGLTGGILVNGATVLMHSTGHTTALSSLSFPPNNFDLFVEMYDATQTGLVEGDVNYVNPLGTGTIAGAEAFAGGGIGPVLDNQAATDPSKVAVNLGYATLAVSNQGHPVVSIPSAPQTPAPAYFSFGADGHVIAGTQSVYCQLLAVYELQPNADLPAIASL